MDAVETLREASRQALARAEAATPGPWASAEMHGRDMCDEAWSERAVVSLANPRRALTDYPGDPIAYTYAQGYEGNDEHADEDADHVASWHPKVAIAVAMIWHEVAHQIAENDLPESDPIAAEAIEAARAYLGEVSS